MLKNSDKLTDKQKAKFIEINQANLLTSRAWKMKENFMEIFEKQTTEVEHPACGEASAFFACLPSGRIVGMKTLLNPI